MSAGRDDKARSALRTKQRFRSKQKRLETKKAQLERRKAYRMKNASMKGKA